MGQPARPIDPQDTDAYGRPITRPDLRAMEGGGEGGAAPAGYSGPQSVPNRPYDDNLYNPQGDTPGRTGGRPNHLRAVPDEPTTGKTAGADSADDLRTAETQTSDADDQVGGGYNPDPKKSRRGRFMAFVTKNRGKMMLGSIGFGGILVTIMVAILSLIPLKIENMMKKLHDRFFSLPDIAIQEGSLKLFSEYVTKHVIPNYKSCGTTIDKNCRVRIVGGEHNPVSNLFNAWSKVKIENTLAVKYGIEFKFDTGSQTWYWKTSGVNGKGYNIGPNGEKLDTLFHQINRADIEKSVTEVAEAIGKTTKIGQIWLRYRVGGQVQRLDEVKRYIFFDGLRNRRDEAVEDLKQSAKIFLTERVLNVHESSTLVAVVCMLDEDCHPDQLEPNLCDPNDPNCVPDPGQSSFDKDQRAKLEALANKFNTDPVEVKKIFDDMSKRGFQKYMTDQVLGKVFGKVVSDAGIQRATDAIPVIGWINLLAEVINAAHEAGPKIKKLAIAVVLAGGAIQLYEGLNTYADEVHTGQVDGNQVGSMTDMLGSGTEDPNDPLVGGTAAAEDAPLYGQVMTGTSTKSNSPLYLCNNGKSLDNSELACPEEQGGGLAIANAVTSFLDEPVNKPLVLVAQVWRGTIGTILKFFSDLGGALLQDVLKVAQAGLDLGCSVPFVPPELQPSSIPPSPITNYCGLRDTIKEQAPKIVEAVSNVLFSNPFGTNMGGARVFQLAALGGAGVAQQACELIGCQKVSPAAASGLINQQYANARTEFSQQPLMARLFSTDSPDSLISQMAIAVPFDMQSSLQNGFASLLSNPLGSLTNSFGSVFSSGRAAALTADDVNPFNLGLDAFPADKMPDDFETYWDQHNCGDASENGPIYKWQAQATDSSNAPTDDHSGMPIHNDVEPCLLIKSVSASAGALFDTSLLSADEQSIISPAGVDASASDDTATIGTDIDLKTLYADSTSVACAPNTKDLGKQDGYTEGRKVPIKICAVSNLPGFGDESKGGYGVTGADGKTIVNSRVSGAAYALTEAAKKDGLTLSSTSAFRTMAHQEALCPCDGVGIALPGRSNHQMGVAIDFTMADPSKFPNSRSSCINVKGRCSAPGDKVWEWLDKNAGQFGFKPYDAEYWHWSPTGN